jgi:UrcA family protein
VGLAAAAPENVRHQVVRFTDLDVTRPAGAQKLYSRIKRAAHEVCQVDGRGGYDRGCAEDAIARAVAKVGSPLLSVRHEALAPRQASQAQQARLDR